MEASATYRRLGWKHELWQYLRLYLDLNKKKQDAVWQPKLTDLLPTDGHFPSEETLALLRGYLDVRTKSLEQALQLLRSEEDARDYCRSLGVTVGVTATRNKDHHQSSKALVSAASHVALNVASEFKLTADVNPQGRCYWYHNHQLSVSPRRLDGAIPGLASPDVIWEIKEYWGQTSGGSKMSDAVYECLLVGLELRLFEEQTGKKVVHACLLDGKEQWNARKSDLLRLIDGLNQGLIDTLIIGEEVESRWGEFLRQALGGTYSTRKEDA